MPGLFFAKKALDACAGYPHGGLPAGGTHAVPGRYTKRNRAEGAAGTAGDYNPGAMQDRDSHGIRTGSDHLSIWRRDLHPE